MSTLILKRTYHSVWLKRIALILAAALLLFGIVSFFRGRGQNAAQATTYEFGEVTRDTVRSSVTATGTIQPWKTVDIKSNVAGRIEKLYVDLGDRVNAGDPIMDIDPTDTQVAVDQAQADLNAALARQTQAELNATQQQAQGRARVTASQRALESARARLAQSRANLTAQPRLTESAINQASASLSAARKAVNQARQGKAQLQEQLKQLREVTIPLSVQTVGSSVEEAQANLETAQADYNRQAELLKKGYVSKSEVETASARLASARAAHRNAVQRSNTLQRENQIAISELNSRIAEAQSRIEQSEAQVQQAQSSLQVARTNGYQNEVRSQEYKAAQAAVRQAEAELDSARAELNQIAVRQKEVTAANAQIVRGQASVKQATTNLGYTRIVAPRAGDKRRARSTSLFSFTGTIADQGRGENRRRLAVAQCSRVVDVPRVALLPDVARHQGTLQADRDGGGMGGGAAVRDDAGLHALFQHLHRRPVRPHPVPGFRLCGIVAVDVFRGRGQQL